MGKVRRTGDAKGVRELLSTLLHGKDRGTDRPRVAYVKPGEEPWDKEKDPWELKKKRKYISLGGAIRTHKGTTFVPSGGTSSALKFREKER